MERGLDITYLSDWGALLENYRHFFVYVLVQKLLLARTNAAIAPLKIELAVDPNLFLVATAARAVKRMRIMLSSLTVVAWRCLYIRRRYRLLAGCCRVGRGRCGHFQR